MGQEWRGGQQQVLYLTEGLEKRGVVSVAALVQGSPLAKRLRDEDLPLIELPGGSPFSPRVVRALHRILADRNWDVIHTHTAHAHTLAHLAFRLPPARPYHKPALFVSRRVDFVPARDPLTRLKYSAPDQHFICVSDAIRRVLHSYGVPGAFLHVVHSGVPIPGCRREDDPLPSEIDPSLRMTERCDLRAELGVPKDAVLLGNIAQFVEHKGHRFLLSAMGKVHCEIPSVHLVLLGSGKLERDLRRQAAELGLGDALTFAGFRPQVRRYLPAMDLFVLSSVEEGLCTSLLDAQAVGLPVVGTEAGGIPEAISAGHTGLLARTRDSDSLADAILELLRSPDTLQSMSRSGPGWVRERFSVDQMVDGTLAVYREVLGAG